MKYTISFFTHINNQEQLVHQYYFDNLPYIPHTQDLIAIKGQQYLVRKISTDYDSKKNQLFEIMLDEVDYNKEWWE